MNNAMLMMSTATKNNIIASLDIMWKGLLAIFIVIGVIAIVTFIMNDMSANHAAGGGIYNKIKAHFKKRKENKNADSNASTEE